MVKFLFGLNNFSVDEITKKVENGEKSECLPVTSGISQGFMLEWVFFPLRRWHTSFKREQYHSFAGDAKVYDDVDRSEDYDDFKAE